MHIVLLQDDFPPESKGGAGNLAAGLALGLLHAGHTVSVIAATQMRENADESDWQGIAVHRIYSDYHERWRAWRSLYNPSTVGAVEKILQKLKPDVVHAHNVHYYLSYWALRVARRHARTVVLTAHDEVLFHYGKFFEFTDASDTAVHPSDFYDYRIGAWQILRRFKKRYNPFRQTVIRYCMQGVRIVSISRASQKMLADNGFKSTVIYNGIDPEAWMPQAAAAERFKEEKKLADKKVICFSGRLSRLKGGEQAVRALALVAQKYDAVLLVAGSINEYAEKMRSLARELGVENRLIYAGWLSPEEMKTVYGASDVVIFPSLYMDPFGLVNLEAMAAHKPVVATSLGGAQEIVADNETGYVVNPYNLESFAERVEQLLEDPVLAKRFGDAGYVRLSEHFTAKLMVDSYLSCYKQGE